MKKYNFYKNLKTFLVIELLLVFSLIFTACNQTAIDWFGDLRTELKEDFSSIFTFYAYTEDVVSSPETFSESYRIGDTLQASDLPLADDSRTSTFKTGYDVVGWKVYRNSVLKNPATDKSQDYCQVQDGVISNITVTSEPLDLYAVYSPSKNTLYKVKHYLQNLSLTGYDFYKEEDYHGTTDTDTQAVALDIPGFTSQSITQTNIEPDGSAVVDIKYDRNPIAINVDDGVNPVTTYNGYYGQKVSDYGFVVPDRLSEGLVIEQWNISYANGSSDVIKGSELTFPPYNGDCTAVWVEKEMDLSVSVIYQPTNDEDLGLNVTIISYASNTQTARISVSSVTLGNHKWYLDGTLLAGHNGDSSFTDDFTLTPGYHSLLLRVENPTGIWSAEALINVKEE